MIFGIFFTHFILDTKLIAINSQKDILLKELKASNLLDSNGSVSGNITKLNEDKIYYLQDKFNFLIENGDKFGLENKKFLEKLNVALDRKWQIFTINSSNIGINVKEATIKSVVTSSVDRDEFIIQLADESVKVNMQKHLEEVLATVNLKPDSDFDVQIFEQLKEKLLIFEVDKRVFVLSSMDIVFDEGVYKFYNANVLFYMEDAELK